MEAVFIGACERSGTTMLGSLLGGHPELFTTPESRFRLDLMAGPGPRGAAAMQQAIERHPRFQQWGMQADWSSMAEESIDPNRLTLHLARSYAHERGQRGSWVDHTPTNLRFALRIAQACDAKFIHLVRDGRAVAASYRRMDIGPSDIIHAAETWLSRIAPGLAAEAVLPASSILRVRYEDLVADPKATLMETCAFLDLPFHEDMLVGSGLAVPGLTRKYHALINQPPDARRSETWRTELSPRDIEIFESIVQDTLPMLGYELVHKGSARSHTAVEWLRRRAYGAVRKPWDVARAQVRERRSLLRARSASEGRD
ncbi:MAG: sulfotransferase family protein [Thermoplasmatota archaeon]